MCWVLSKLLSERGHEVRAAYTEASALKALASGFECQVAIVDYRLPDSNGIALILEMRSRLPRLQSILMTSYGNACLRQLAMDEKLFAYLDKPFNNGLMIRTVEDALCAWETGDDSLARGTHTQTLFPGRALSQK
jgi:two-component system response regulator HydG